jgi:predicted ribosome quality control (RQC) complex YloA/Tae2 family protein
MALACFSVNSNRSAYAPAESGALATWVVCFQNEAQNGNGEHPACGASCSSARRLVTSPRLRSTVAQGDAAVPVPLDSFTVGFLADELDDLLRGREVRHVGIGEDRIVVVTFADAPSELRFLFDTTFPLLFLETQPRGRPMWEHAARFEEPLQDARVTAVEQIGLERVIRISVGAEGGRVHHLYVELTPPLPNLFLADADDKVEAVLLRAGTKTRKRTVEQGAGYTPPEAPAKLDPLGVTPEDLAALPWQRDHDALSKAIQGISPFTSREIISRASAGSLGQAFREFLADYQARRPYPCTFNVSPALAKRPPLVGIAWYRPRMEGVTDVRPMPSINAAASVAFHAFLKTSALDRRRSAVLNAIARDAARWETAARGAAEAVAHKPVAAELRRFAELILGNPGAIKKGAAEVLLRDIYSEAEREVVVPLQARLTAHANADAYFKKARKIERSAALAAENATKARRRLRDLEVLRKEAESAEVTFARLKQMEEEIAHRVIPRKEREEEADARATVVGIKPRRFVVAGGWTVLVGRSAAENDLLTHRYARPSDLWFHARQAQGSHVVLRRDKRKTEPPREAIIEAARIAAHYSKAKTSKHVPVSYTEKRYVKKVRGGAPGLAAMLREKVVFVTPAAPREDQAV